MIHDDYKYCEWILPKVSRTFALSVDVLTGKLRHSVLVSYLLCRILDTIEDDRNLPGKTKVILLEQFKELFHAPHLIQEFSETATLSMKSNPWDLDLVKNTHRVFALYQTLPLATQNIIKEKVSEMATGMAKFVGEYPNGLRIQTVPEFKEYCYYVAGVVGHLLTSLWCEFSPGMSQHKNKKELFRLSEKFGEALQTTNIAKDLYWDFKEENSIYMPEEILKNFGSQHATFFNQTFDKAHLKSYDALLQIAQDNVRDALAYIKCIPKSSPRIRLFCIIPILLSIATLHKLGQVSCLESLIEGVKITRQEVERVQKLSLYSMFSNSCLTRAVEELSSLGEPTA